MDIFLRFMSKAERYLFYLLYIRKDFFLSVLLQLKFKKTFSYGRFVEIYANLAETYFNYNLDRDEE